MLILVLVVPLINLISALIHGASRLRPLDEMGLGFFIQDAVSDYYRRAVIDEFLLSILSTAISLVLVIVVLYITASLLKVESHFMTITTRFGVLMTVPTAIFIAGSLIMLIGVPTLGNIINACAMFATGLAIINTYRSLEVKESKLDPFHMYLDHRRHLLPAAPHRRDDLLTISSIINMGLSNMSVITDGWTAPLRLHMNMQTSRSGA